VVGYLFDVAHPAWRVGMRVDGWVLRYADELQTLTRLLEPFTIFGAHTFPHDRWPALKPYELSLVEQAICVRAMAFVASGLSAWSGNVVRRCRLCPPSHAASSKQPAPGCSGSRQIGTCPCTRGKALKIPRRRAQTPTFPIVWLLRLRIDQAPGVRGCTSAASDSDVGLDGRWRCG
jgi:hypothetical protein